MILVRMTRMLAALLAATVVVVGSADAPVSARSAPLARAQDAGAEADFVDRINGARGAAGRGGLATDGELTSIARRWSQRMANDGRLSHNPNLANEVSHNWEKLAENVGFGQNVGQIHDAFMNSTGHRNNILDGAMTHVGVGVIIDGSGQMWVTEVFMRLRGGGSSPPPTSPPPTQPPPTQPSPTQPPPTAAPPPTAPPTTRAPRPTTPPTVRPTTPPTVAPPVTEPPPPPAPPPEPEPEPAPVMTARTPTPRLVLVLDGLRALDQGR